MTSSYTENNMEIDENDIIRRIQNGETELFQILSNIYLPIINNYISLWDSSQIDREDLIQEALLSLYVATGVYNFKLSSFKTFASICIKRSIISSLRHLSQKKQIPSSLITSLDDIEVFGEDNPEISFIDKESYISFSDKIRLCLSSFEYSVLTAYLKYGDYSKICTKLNTGTKEVNNALQRARKKIKKINR